jgi:iron(III) transport system substrate-binding protein
MMMIDRRGMLALGAWAAATSKAFAQGPMPEHERVLYEAARREGEITWYSGQYSAEASEAAGRAFNERYPGVRCNVVRSTSQVAFQRLSQDLRAGVAQCDVLSSTNGGHYVQLKRQNRLMQFRPKNADGLLPALRVADPDNFYQSSFLGIYLLAHNTRLVSEADAPKSWKDILDSKWKDKLAVGHPGFSGAIGLWAMEMRRLYGWDYFKQLERNKPQIGRSSRGNPLKLIYPEEGVLAALSPSAIIRNAPHPNAAKLFMEFQTGVGLSTAIRLLFNESIRPDVAPPEGSRPLDQVKMLAPSIEDAEKGVPEVRDAWRETFGV